MSVVHYDNFGLCYPCTKKVTLRNLNSQTIGDVTCMRCLDKLLVDFQMDQDMAENDLLEAEENIEITQKRIKSLKRSASRKKAKRRKK